MSHAGLAESYSVLRRFDEAREHADAAIHLLEPLASRTNSMLLKRRIADAYGEFARAEVGLGHFARGCALYADTVRRVNEVRAAGGLDDGSERGWKALLDEFSRCPR